MEVLLKFYLAKQWSFADGELILASDFRVYHKLTHEEILHGEGLDTLQDSCGLKARLRRKRRKRRSRTIHGLQ